MLIKGDIEKYTKPNPEALRSNRFISKTIYFETGGDKNGAYHVDKHDIGKATKWGISQRAYPNLDIKKLTYNKARNIYKNNYYNKYYDRIPSEILAFKVFDMGVLLGVMTSVRLLQTALKREYGFIKVDGKFGPISLKACIEISNDIFVEEEVYSRYIKILNNNFNKLAAIRPTNIKFLKGWKKRANYIYSIDD